jgi:importin subunit beta-1
MLTFFSDIADSFPNGEFAAFLRNDWVTSFVREVRTNPHYSQRTLDTARWSREQVKRQINLATAAAMS